MVESLDQLITWIHASLNHIEGQAIEACQRSLQFLKADPFNENLILKHYENCRKFKDAQDMISKFTDILDSFQPKC